MRHGRSFSTDFLLLLEAGVCEELGGGNFTPGLKTTMHGKGSPRLPPCALDRVDRGFLFRKRAFHHHRLSGCHVHSSRASILKPHCRLLFQLRRERARLRAKARQIHFHLDIPSATASEANDIDPKTTMLDATYPRWSPTAISFSIQQNRKT